MVGVGAEIADGGQAAADVSTVAILCRDTEPSISILQSAEARRHLWHNYQHLKMGAKYS